MIRKRLNMIFSSKLFYIVFSILVAFMLWMYVEINENQVQRIPVRNIRIVRLNEDILTDRGLLISEITDSVTLTFECPRSIAVKLDNTSVTVVIDLINIAVRGPTTLPYEVVYPSGIDLNLISIVNRTVGSISLYIDRLDSKPAPVEVIYKGGIAEGHIQDPLEYKPQSITVSGPTEDVSRVAAVRVNVPRENLTSTYADDLPFIILDENGEELDATVRDKLTFSEDRVHVTIPIRVTKEVVLTVDLSPGSGATDQNTRVTLAPPIITIAGEPEDVRNFNTINIGTIDLTMFVSSNTYAFPIVLPNYFTNISGETEATVLVEVFGLELRYFSVSISSIHVTNVPLGYSATIKTQSLDVRIRGRADSIRPEILTEANIRAVASLADLGPGTHRVPARIYIDGIDADIGAIGNNFIIVDIARDT